jgi:hypothetical protein
MQEQHSGVAGLPHIQFVFLELPKYEGGPDPHTLVDKCACFFREAGNLLAIPEALQHPPVLDALEGARTARFSREEWDAYIAAGMAIQNERGALSLARKEGRPPRAHATCSRCSGFAASSWRMSSATASWARVIRRGWSGGTSEPSLQHRLLKCSRSRAEARCAKLPCSNQHG